MIIMYQSSFGYHTTNSKMLTKLFFLAAVVCAVSAQYGHGHGHEHGHAYSSQHLHKHDGHAQLVTFKDKHGHEHHDYYAYPKYEFGYKVVDPHTGDQKSQEEHRDGDKVTGFYSFHEADGTTRIVHYTADKHSGFQADVKRVGHAQHIVPTHHH